MTLAVCVVLLHRYSDAMTAELLSQLILAFATIVRCGKDRDEFTTNIDSLCCGALDNDAKARLFESFSLIAMWFPDLQI